MEYRVKCSFFAVITFMCMAINANGLRPRQDIIKQESNQERLCYAAMQGNLEMVKLLINQGAPIDFQREEGSNLLHYLAYWPDRTSKIASYICKNHDVQKLLNAHDKNGMTPIMWAHVNKSQKLVKLFKKHGAKINFKERVRCFFLIPFKKGANSEPMLTSKFALVGGLFQSIGTGLKRTLFGK